MGGWSDEVLMEWFEINSNIHRTDGNKNDKIKSHFFTSFSIILCDLLVECWRLVLLGQPARRSPPAAHHADERNT